MIRITRIDDDERRTLRIEGRVTREGVGPLREASDACLAEGARLELDLSSVDFADEAGVALLRELAGRARLRGCSGFLRALIERGTA